MYYKNKETNLPSLSVSLLLSSFTRHELWLLSCLADLAGNTLARTLSVVLFLFDETKKIIEDQYVQLNEVLVRDVTLPAAIKDAIERKLGQEQESLEYEFRLAKAKKEAEKQRIEAQGKADANSILSASLTDKILQDKGIEATLQMAQSPNSKVIVIGGGDSGLPIILGNN